jgi:hypothetical protein
VLIQPAAPVRNEADAPIAIRICAFHSAYSRNVTVAVADLAFTLDTALDMPISGADAAAIDFPSFL